MKTGDGHTCECRAKQGDYSDDLVGMHDFNRSLESV
jgi:hypothetical protein